MSRQRLGRKVLVVLHESELGGASRSVLQAVRALDRYGWEFAFWVSRPSPLDDELRSAGWSTNGAPRHLRYRWSAWREPPGLGQRARTIPRYFRDFHRLVRSQRFALVHANTLLTIPEAAVAHRAGQNTLVHVHEMLPDTLRGKVASRALRSVADRIIAVSEASRARLERQSVDSSVVYDGTLIPPDAPTREHARLVVGTLGTVSRRKGTDLFVDAACEVRRLAPDVEFRIVGPRAEGAERSWADAVIDRARRSGLTYVTCPDVWAEMATWDLFVLPSREDPFPLAVLEAMASGLPVVATRVDGIPEQVTQDTGVLVPPADSEKLAAAIAALLDRPVDRERLGTAGRLRVSDLFTVERQASGLDRAYTAVLEDRADPSAR